MNIHPLRTVFFFIFILGAIWQTNYILFIFPRENGADSILDLGLPEAPEKSQVNKIYNLFPLFVN